MPKQQQAPAREAFVQLLTQIVNDEQAVDVPTRYAALIRILGDVHLSIESFRDHSDLHGAIFALAQYAPNTPVALRLAERLTGSPTDLSRAPEVMRAWLEAYLETTGWEPKAPPIDLSRSGLRGSEDVEAHSANYEGATYPVAGCCVKLYSESTRFG